MVILFLAGDAMTGRGVDQVMPHPSPPDLHEPWVTDALEYVRLAEARSGPLPRGVAPTYIWGDALAEWDRVAPAARIVNLETSITHSGEYDHGKGIHYRMNPANVECLTAAGLNVCVVANNHVLDYGRSGLGETLGTLRRAGVHTAGAGRDLDEARRPLSRPLPGGGRLVVAACAHDSSGVPLDWAAGKGRPGVHRLPDLSDDTADALAATCGPKGRGDIVVVSIHWGDNWGYDVPERHIAFAHRLVDRGADVVHGHSSHHVRPVEIYRDRLILYGCGDFIDDYEGIEGYEQYRDDLPLMFFPSLDEATGRLLAVHVTPMQIRRFRLHRAPPADARWMRDTMDRISAPFGVRASLDPGGRLALSPRSKGQPGIPRPESDRPS